VVIGEADATTVVRYARMRSLTSAILVGICACGGKPAPTAKQPAPVAPAPPPTPEAFSVPDAHDVEVFTPAWTKVAIGQTISFSTATIDQDLDETRVDVTRMPATATFDAITQTITWTPNASDVPRGDFTLAISQPGRGKHIEKSFSIDVVKGKPVAAPVAPAQSPVIETLLMIRTPGRLAQVNKDWPLDKLLEVGAETFRLQIPEDKRKALGPPIDGKTAYEQMLAGLAATHANTRLDPTSPDFDKAAFGDPRSWKIVAFRPRIDKAWTELRVVYQAINAREPVFAMFRLRPVVEYVPAGPRPDEEREANNKIFLGMVARHLMKDGGPNPTFVKDEAAEGRAVSALMTELMTFDDTKTRPYLHGFSIGIALGARMGGGSARNPDGSYKSGDGWAWSAQKPFATRDGKRQAYVNVAIPGFWTDTQPSKDGTTWVPRCAEHFTDLCRKTMGLVDLPGHGKIDANNLYFEHKMKWSVEKVALTDGRRDLGEENGMTCSQCHIRNFGMHDFSDPAPTDPSKGMPKAPNHAIGTLAFQIIPGARWEDFTLEFLQYQQCRGKLLLTQYLGADAAKGLTCPLAK
jgi:hypothetical protein